MAYSAVVLTTKLSRQITFAMTKTGTKITQINYLTYEMISLVLHIQVFSKVTPLLC